MSTERAVSAQCEYAQTRLVEAMMRTAKRYALRADVSRFYNSIYTHTIEWAVHTKHLVKRNRTLPRSQRSDLWGGALDQCHRNLQHGQSVGIPIGPDTSLIAAEVLLARVDELLSKCVRCTGWRYLDDYELYFSDHGQAESALSELQATLGDYQLGLNPTKTEIAELPLPLKKPWARTIRREGVRRNASGEGTDFVDLFDAAFELRQSEPEQHVLQYAMGSVRHVTCRPQDWLVVESLFLQGMTIEPGIIREVLSELLRYRALGRQLSTDRIAETLAQTIVRHARLGYGSEVAWALWAHIQLAIPLDATELDAVEGMNDAIVALVALDAAERRLTPRAPASAVWGGTMTANELTEAGWLLACEGAVKGWFPETHIRRDADFAAMRNARVEFCERLPMPEQVPIRLPGGGGGGAGASP